MFLYRAVLSPQTSLKSLSGAWMYCCVGGLAEGQMGIVALTLLQGLLHHMQGQLRVRLSVPVAHQDGGGCPDVSAVSWRLQGGGQTAL